jgi:hypothetical protein
MVELVIWVVFFLLLMLFDALLDNYSSEELEEMGIVLEYSSI